MNSLPEKKSLFGIRLELLICVLIAVAVLAVYLQTVRYDFIELKDNIFVYENPYLWDGLSVRNTIRAFTFTRDGLWVPATMISYMIDYEIFGLNPGWYHFVNILFHLANSVLLFLLFRGLTGALWRSACVAVLFALHPLNVESVAWITERMNVLSLFLTLCALSVYAVYVKRPSVRGYFSVFLLFSVALLAKPTVVVFPLVLLLLDFWPLGRFEVKTEYVRKKRSKKALVPRQVKPDILSIIVEKIPFFALSIFITFIASAVSRMSGGLITSDLPAFSQRLMNAIVSSVAYMIKLLLPFRLTVLSPDGDAEIFLVKVIAAGLLLAVVTVLILREARKSPLYTFGWFWYLSTFILSIAIIQTNQRQTMDNVMYLPMIGLSVFIVWGTELFSTRWNQRKKALGVIAGIVFIAIMILSWRQVRVWKDSVSLYEHALAVTHNNYLAHNKLGNALQLQYDIEEAADHYREALRISPDFPEANINLGNSLAQLGDFDEAMQYYEKAADLKPDDPEVFTRMGITYGMQGRFEEAIPYYNKAIEINPSFEMAYHNLGYSLAVLGNLNEAIEQFNTILRINPYYVPAHTSLGDILIRQNRYEEAVTFYSNAVSIDPNTIEARKSLALALAQIDRVQEAIAQLRAVLDINPDDLSTLNNIGVFLYGQGRYEETAEIYERALEIMPNNPLLHRNYAAALNELGRTDEADIHIQEAEQIELQIPQQ